MRLTLTNRWFRCYAPYALGGLLCLCFFLALHSQKSSKTSSESVAQPAEVARLSQLVPCRSRATSAGCATLAADFHYFRAARSVMSNSSENGFSSPHEPEKESTSPPDRGSAKPIVAPAQFSIRVAMRDKHSPAHPSNLPPEPFTRPALSSSYSPPNNLADIRSRIFLSPLQDRAPPRFA